MLVVVLITIGFLIAEADVLLGPSDTEAIIGTDITLNCSLATHQSPACSVEWTHKRSNSDMFQVIYTSCFTIGEFGDRYSVVGNATHGEYNLKIKNVSLQDFGTYTCRDNTDGFYRRAQLIVYDTYPSTEFCSIEGPHDGPIGNNTCGIEPDKVKLSCNMRFSGNVIPTMEWIQTDGDVITENITTTLYNNRVTVSSLALNAAHIRSTVYTCRIKYLQSSLESNISWSTTLRIFNTTHRTESVSLKHSSQEFDCSKTTDLAKNCSFSWEHDGKRLSDEGSVIKLTEDRKGNYTCSAICRIRGRNCSISSITIYVSSDLQTASMKDLMTKIVQAAVILVVLLIGGLVLGLRYHIRRKICFLHKKPSYKTGRSNGYGGTSVNKYTDDSDSTSDAVIGA